tara:strand:+ start:1079 stop:1723 length:645 start_codon:yes stop_codon:yes gene_type:complete
MTEETEVILNNQKTINLKSIFLNYKKTIISVLVILLIILFGYFFYIDHKKKSRIEISERYNLAIINHDNSDPISSILEMKRIVNIKDPTYSPLALYFLLDNNLLKNKDEINKFFDLLIQQTNTSEEIKNLIIYKKGLYNSETASEEELLSIFNPLIKSQNLWKSHSLYVIAEYFFSKNEKQKSKEFFEKILEMENSNPQIKIEAQKRLQRDFGV